MTKEIFDDLIVGGTITTGVGEVGLRKGTYFPTITDSANAGGDSLITNIPTTAPVTWTRLGSQVWVGGRVVWTNTQNSGNVHISLPFNISSDADYRCCASLGFISGVTFTNQLILSGSRTGRNVALRELDLTGLAATNVTKADLSTAGNFQIQFSVQYITDDD